MVQSEQFDCVVIGGGPAGSTVGALVAEAGFSTLILEREWFPRPHVGESLMPETYWVFERLGVLDKLRASAYPRKVGVQFVSRSGRESQPFLFRTHDPRECSVTWHVDRGEFDQLLFDNAAEKGADCRCGARVRDIVFEGDRAVGVVVQAAPSDTNAATKTINAKVVVDATGQRGLISNKLGIRRVNPQLRKAAIWGHFRGGTRDTSEVVLKRSFYIPIPSKRGFGTFPRQRILSVLESLPITIICLKVRKPCKRSLPGNGQIAMPSISVWSMRIWSMNSWSTKSFRTRPIGLLAMDGSWLVMLGDSLTRSIHREFISL